MPVLPIADDSVDQAMAALRAGSPIVIPAPSPMAYAITGRGQHHGALTVTWGSSLVPASRRRRSCGRPMLAGLRR
jgi:hypothetical protein